jgi:hypothetical protein
VIYLLEAEVAELADAPALGAGGRKAVGVQVPSSADLSERILSRFDNSECFIGVLHFPASDKRDSAGQKNANTGSAGNSEHGKDCTGHLIVNHEHRVYTSWLTVSDGHGR